MKAICKWKGLSRNTDRSSYLCSVLSSRKLTFGKSQDGEVGVLLGKWIWALDNFRLSEFPDKSRVRGCWDVNPPKINSMS